MKQIYPTENGAAAALEITGIIIYMLGFLLLFQSIFAWCIVTMYTMIYKEKTSGKAEKIKQEIATNKKDLSIEIITKQKNPLFINNNTKFIEGILNDLITNVTDKIATDLIITQLLLSIIDELVDGYDDELKNEEVGEDNEINLANFLLSQW